MPRWLANTKGQCLIQHSSAIAILAYHLASKLGVQEQKLQRACFLAGLYHDIGKLGSFQDFINKNGKIKTEDTEDGHHQRETTANFGNLPRHNEISFLLLDELIERRFCAINNKPLSNAVKHTALWHHALPLRHPKKQDFSSNKALYNRLCVGENRVWREIVTELECFLEATKSQLPDEYNDWLNLDDFDLDHALEEDFEPKTSPIPAYKQYEQPPALSLDLFLKQTMINAQADYMRAILITADRYISSITADKLSQLASLDYQSLEQVADELLTNRSTLCDAISTSLASFEEKFPGSERNAEQKRVAETITSLKYRSNTKVATLGGPAGVGKTKIALECAQRSGARKILWVCPRVQVCQSVYEQLRSVDYLPSSRIELISGEFKLSSQNGVEYETKPNKLFNGDIVVTTIDQIISAISTHRNAHVLFEYLDSYIVFDEFHEYAVMSGFSLIFKELIELKKLQSDRCFVLLVSATPNVLYLEKVLGINKKDIVKARSFNSQPYWLNLATFNEAEINDLHPLYMPQKDHTVVISNTATTAQLAFIYNYEREKACLAHSKFTPSDKQGLFKTIMASFGQGQLRHSKYDVLRAGPIVQASLNITGRKMVSEISTAENILQRIGRLDRFGEGYENFCLLVQAAGNNSAQKRILKQNYSSSNAEKFIGFLSDMGVFGKTIQLTDLYNHYYAFYDQVDEKPLMAELLALLNDSAQLAEMVLLNPIQLPPSLSRNADKKKLQTLSLRGSSVYAQMILVDYPQTASNKTLYDAEDPETYGQALTVTHGQVSQEIYHRQLDNCKILPNSKLYKGVNYGLSLASVAKRPETPIIYSYTDSQLKAIGKDQLESALIYVNCGSSIVGAVKYRHLIELKQIQGY